MSLKKQAEEILAIANEIEKQAAEVTNFVCKDCNHTTTLAKINAARKTAANEVGENVTVADISVSDEISCPACQGVMAYVETEASAPYYYDDAVEAKAADPEEKEEKEDCKTASTEPIDYDAIDRYLKG